MVFKVEDINQLSPFCVRQELLGQRHLYICIVNVELDHNEVIFTEVFLQHDKSVDEEDEEDYNVRPGHMYPGVPTLPPNFGHHTKTLEELVELEKELNDHRHDVDARLAEVRDQKEKLLKQGSDKDTDEDEIF